MDYHSKSGVLAPVLDDLNLFERYEKYGYTLQRLHYFHQVNVFLTGLYIYHNFPLLQEKLHKEIRKTTVEIPMTSYGVFRYSDGSEFGEFLYRWRLASLCHDIGTPIQLLNGKTNQINQFLMQLPFEKPVNSLKELCGFNGHDILKELDSACKEISLIDYIKYQNESPFKNLVYNDHGIIGALLFLRLIHEEYSRHKEGEITKTRIRSVFWHSELLHNSILQIARPIALHNLDLYPEAFNVSAKTQTIFDLESRPLSWLLKISDILQEWDKPLAKKELPDIPQNNFYLSFSKNKIFVNNFPEEKIDKIKQNLSKYTKPKGVVDFV